jgi:predicted metal-dependent phosphoesterase TrpH
MKWLWILLILVITLPFFHVQGPQLVDLTAVSPPPGVSLEPDQLRPLAEPFIGLAQYFYSLNNLKPRLEVWFFWAAAIPALVTLLRKRRIKSAVSAILLSWLALLTLLVLFMLLPLPAEHLKAPNDWLRIDFHSHTWHSWDGIASPEKSMKDHMRQGYDRFFVTDHWNTDALSDFSRADQLNVVFPGEEIAGNGNRFLILADRKFTASGFKGKDAKEVIQIAHKQGFLVIAPHYPDHDTWAQLADLGIDGFEVYDSADRAFGLDTPTALIKFCKEKNLLMVGGTDYHGRCSLSDVWTLVRKAPENGKPGQTLTDLLRMRNDVHVMVRTMPGQLTGKMSFLEPFAGIYHYLGSMTLTQSLSWAGWILLIMLLCSKLGGRKLARFIALLLCLCFVSYGAYFSYIWYSIHPGSEILMSRIIPALALLAFTWYLVWRNLNIKRVLARRRRANL